MLWHNFIEFLSDFLIHETIYGFLLCFVPDVAPLIPVTDDLF